MSDPNVCGTQDRLTITVVETAPEERWVLQGRLTDYPAAELLCNWHVSKCHESAGRRVIDLDGVSVIDRNGERVLSMLIHDGARFGGIYARHLLVALLENTKLRQQLS